MRRYIDLVTRFINEAIAAELELVPAPGMAREIGSGGSTVGGIRDLLPHRARKKRDPPPEPSKQPRNTDPILTLVPDKGDAKATLHKDYVGKHADTQPIIPIE
jgi:hypothetical protein